MEDQEGKYNIKAAALMLGIQPGTLRAWERRYQMIAPVRNEAGHRLYTEEHIRILKWLIKKVNQGFTISQAISLMGHNQIQIDPEDLNLNQGNPLTYLTHSLYDALIHFENERINEILNSMFSIFTMEKVIFELFSQVLLKLEDSFKSGKINSAQRNYSLSYLKARIITIVYNIPVNQNSNKAISLSFSKDGEDFEQLMFCFYLRKRGIEVINIGAYHSEEDVKEALEIIHPDLFIIFCDNQESLNDTLSLVEQLSLNAQELTIGLGGKAITAIKSPDKERYSTNILGHTSNEWEFWLNERMVF